MAFSPNNHHYNLFFSQIRAFFLWNMMINHQPWEKSDVQPPNDLCCQKKIAAWKSWMLFLLRTGDDQNCQSPVYSVAGDRAGPGDGDATE